MMRFPMSRAASGLLRALLARVGDDRDRILLTALQSVDWQSLTFTGERHQFLFHIVGRDAGQVHRRLVSEIADHEFAIPGQIVADISAEAPTRAIDGSISVRIEALTIAE